jgi:hypothetical protein
MTEDSERQKIVQAVRAYIAKERISREEFAERAKLGKSTVDKLVVGLFSEKTILQTQSRLNLDLLQTPAAGEVAGEEFGRYSRDETKNYIGDYVFARPTFVGDGTIHAFHMEILWDRDAAALVVRESARRKREGVQFGKIYIPRASMYIFILSNESGWLKKAILSQIDMYKRMRGVMLTMGHAFANVYAPVAMPVIMNKYEKIEDHMIGTIGSKAPMFAEYHRDLASVEKDQYARWVKLDPI